MIYINTKEKEAKALKDYINNTLKIVGYHFKGINLLNKVISIKELYKLSSDVGKLDKACYELFKLDDTLKIRYSTEIEQLSFIIAEMQEMNSFLKVEIKKCNIGEGKVVYRSDLEKLKTFESKVALLKNILKSEGMESLIEELKLNLKQEAKSEGRRHNIKAYKVDEILTSILKRLRNIINIDFEVTLVADISDETIFVEKFYKKFIGKSSKILEEDKEKIKRYRTLLIEMKS